MRLSELRHGRPLPDRYPLAVLLVIVAVVTGWGLPFYPALNGDEGIYAEQARAVLHGQLAPYTYTYDHPFLGWIQLAVPAWVAQSLHLGGELSVVNTRFVMLVLQLVNCLLLYVIARRLGLSWIFATLAVLLFALSPLTVVLSRQVYLDNIALPWVLLAFCLMLNPSRNSWIFALGGAAFAVAVLSKETVLLFAPALFFLLRQRVVGAVRIMATTATAGLLVLILGLYPLFALLRSELLPGAHHVSLWGNGVLYQLAARPGSGAVWDTHSARHHLVAGWVTFDRFLLGGGLLAAVVTAADRGRRWICVALLCAYLPILKPGGYLPAMYATCLLPFSGLAMASVLQRCWAAAGTRQPWWRRAAAGAAALCLAGLGVVDVVPAYTRGDLAANTADATSAARSARDYLIAHTTPADTVLTDDAFIVDLNRHGSADPWRQAVSYYKYDLDPAARHLVRNGRISYVVETPQMQANVGAGGLPFTRRALERSRVVARFGSGDGVILIRKTP